MKEVKVSINDLISAANYSVEETTVPPYDKIVENFSSTWKELYLDEELKEQEGQHCFIIRDNCDGTIKTILVQPEFNNDVKCNIIDVMDVVIFDLIFKDITEQLGKKQFDGYPELLEYIRKHKTAQEIISDDDYSWLLILAEDRLDLVTL